MPAQTRRPLRITTALLAPAMVFAMSAPSSGGTSSGWPTVLPEGSLGSVTRAIDQADELREAFGSGSFLATMRGLLAANGGRQISTPAIPVAAPDSSLPVGLREPVAGLDAAARRAVAMLGSIPRADLHTYVRDVGESYTRFMLEAPAAMPRAPQNPRQATRPIAPQPRYPEAVSPPASVRRAIIAAPDAAMLFAAALDRHMPALRAASRAEEPTGTEAPVCDVRDVRPFLCVSSSGDQTYTAADDAVLIIDQGGNDTYANSAAGAPFLPAASAAYLPVSIVLDQAGDDTYTSARAPWAFPLSVFTYQLRVADAGSIAGGVSLLVDDAGNDVHVDPAPPAGGPGKAAMSLVQGGTLDGVAALIDRGGNDRYEATAQDGTRDYVAVFAQGGGLSFLAAQPQTAPVFAGSGEGAVAALVDRGTGNDSYLMDSGTLTGGTDTPAQGNHVLNGQGYVSLGVGVLADEGGADSIRAVGESTRLDVTRYPDASESWAAPDTTIRAQAFGLGPVFGNTQAPKGYAAVLTGEGNTTYDMQVHSSGFSVNQLWGQGFAGGDGASVIDDVGGNDRYRGSSELTYEPTLLVNQCGPLTDRECTRAEAVIDANRMLLTSWMYLQGEGGVTGEALLHDRSGDDSYTARFLGTTDVLLDDRLPAPDAAPRLEVTGYGADFIGAQGHTGLGQGVLLDEAGTDRYEIRNETETTADATSANAPGIPNVVATAAPKGGTRGQGAGEWFLGSTQTAALIDRGGTGDRFIGVSDNRVTNLVDPDKAYRWGWNWPSGVQGNGFQGALVADGENPHIWSSPAQGVCPLSPGYRGFGEWHFCGQQGTDPDHQIYDGIPAFLAPLPNIWATGRAPKASGAPPSLAFGSGTPAGGTAPGVAEVSARLLGPDGQPIAGAPVRFDIQASGAGSLVDDPRFTVFFNYWEAVGVTNADGVASARLPFRFGFLQSGTYPMRLMATYDGADGIYPAHVTAPFTVTVP